MTQKKGHEMKRVLPITLSAAALTVAALTDTEKKELADRLFHVMERHPFTVVPSEKIQPVEEPGRIIIKAYIPFTKSRAASAFRYTETNGIPREAVLEAAKADVMDYIALEAASPENIAVAAHRFELMLWLLRASEDSSVPPFLEEVSFGAGGEWTRKNAVYAYIDLTGTNSVPFLRKLMADGRYAKSNFTFPLAEFLRILEKGQEINDESLAFLLEFVEKNEFTHNVRYVDRTLCKILPGYLNSVQRLAVAKWHSENGDPFSDATKGYFSEAKRAIEKIPESERKDFRAKGELLDPERRKAP